MSPVAILDRLFSKREIVNCDRDVYLHRWYVIRTAPFALFIHKFIRSDEDRALHDHPWNFIVIPIWRGYYEHREVTRGSLGQFQETIRVRVLPILGTRIRRATHKHRVELLKGMVKCEPFKPFESCDDEIVGFEEVLPSWSIFIRFREFRDWGFHMPEGWIQWNKFWQDKCE